ncbi:3-isopropylmalate dehydratase [Xylophilus rhododendri]|uniref:3-isopropylmalate dehydratase n=1 Tax=Xylophilus rhododendri TaxID=2697032 RepID=A0A857J6M1_9BURK|nr:3-isopropylmalate dehydratase [Xylophilus rhododendri]QHI99650.1 3-isopropylmalate dehydratase [Xylophilus rhododendri]
MTLALQLAGRVMTVGDDISTDLIYPARYMPLRAPQEQAAHVLEGLGEAANAQARSSAVLAAGWNFGCGSSREQAATALRHAGVRLVVARSFARLFFRNCINTGLPVIESEALADRLLAGEEVAVDLEAGIARMASGELRFAPLPEPLLDILRHGGLLGHLRGQAA